MLSPKTAFIHLFNIHSLCTYYVPCTVLHNGETSVDEAGKKNKLVSPHSHSSTEDRQLTDSQ